MDTEKSEEKFVKLPFCWLEHQKYQNKHQLVLY